MTEPTTSGTSVPRRTIIAGAAWSIPVIGLAVAAPAAAASGAVPTLEFINGPYSATACEAVPDITIQLTTDGTTPDAGAAVSVQLPDGLTWSDGTTTPRAFTTNANGQVVLTGVLAPANNGSYVINATSGSLSATATATVTGAKAVTQTLTGSQTAPSQTLPSVLNGEKVFKWQGGTAVLDENGGLYSISAAGPALIASNVVTAYADYENPGILVWSTAAGLIQSRVGNTTTTLGTVPNATKVLKWGGGTAVLDDSGRLYVYQGGGAFTLLASNVVDAYSNYDLGAGGQTGALAWVDTTGTAQYILGGSTTPRVLAGVVPNPARVFKWQGGTAVLDTAGNLYRYAGTGWVLLDSNVVDAYADYEDPGYLTWATSAGVVHNYNGQTSTLPTMPNAVRVFKWQGGTAVLDADRNLYRFSGGTWLLLSENVIDAYTNFDTNTGSLAWIAATC